MDGSGFRTLPAGADAPAPAGRAVAEADGAAAAGANLDPRALRHSFAAFPTGVALVAGSVEGRPVGMLANSFTSVSLEPPLVSVNINRASPTLQLLRRCPRWGISVLGDQQAAVFARLARSAQMRFRDVETTAQADGSVLLPGAVASFIVGREAEMDAGDHVIALLRVLEHRRAAASAPLVFYGSSLHRLRGGPP